MSYVAIVAWDENNRITKFQDFDTLQAAQDHADAVSSSWPGAFAAEKPEGPVSEWLVDGEEGTVSRSLDAGQIQAEAIELIARVKSEAEGASMAFLTPGTAKSQKYTAKKAEAESWSNDTSPRDLTNYPFALREAAALEGIALFEPETGDLVSAADLAAMEDVTEALVGAVIAIYQATSAAYVGIGSAIEGLEQDATAAISAARDAAVSALGENPPDTATADAQISTMRSAAALNWPTPS
ncbi:hypothetical protein [Thalassobaculum litoreum]|uniref:Uncharacterized protein n=1 Tax=Thalassobaculum litoreum DSM 18839 TaxID=1123362 RepID=A0A8G2EVV4_9PROT|nr:hypothetical protein [Thalassobaculum litoreum]SDF46212.1 hypothetical protein SAMN05660686_01441 [Thalassobaculum litoreum DSM 18839]